MSFYDEVASDLREIESDLPGNTLSTGDVVEAPCIPSSIRKGEVLDVGGYQAEIVQTLRVRSSYFETEPEPETAITWTRGDTETQYRIGQVKFPAPFAHYEIDIVDLSESRR